LSVRCFLSPDKYIYGERERRKDDTCGQVNKRKDPQANAHTETYSTYSRAGLSMRSLKRRRPWVMTCSAVENGVPTGSTISAWVFCAGTCARLTMPNRPCEGRKRNSEKRETKDERDDVVLMRCLGTFCDSLAPSLFLPCTARAHLFPGAIFYFFLYIYFLGPAWPVLRFLRCYPPSHQNAFCLQVSSGPFDVVLSCPHRFWSVSIPLPSSPLLSTPFFSFLFPPAVGI